MGSQSSPRLASGAPSKRKAAPRRCATRPMTQTLREASPPPWGRSSALESVLLWVMTSPAFTSACISSPVRWVENSVSPFKMTLKKAVCSSA